MICEFCNSENDGLYGSGRFCSEKCARGYATLNKREDINQRVSKKLKGKLHPRKNHIWTKEERKIHSQKIKSVYEKRILNTPFEKLGRGAQKKFLFKMQDEKCARCKQFFIWLGKPLMQELHHIDGDDKNRTLKNSELLCPNCHSITDNYMFKNRHHKQESKDKMLNTMRNNGRLV